MMSGLRVLAVTNMYPVDDDPGFGPFVASQMQSVTRAGVNVTVEFVDGRTRKTAYVRGIGRVRRLTRSGEFDLVHAHYGVTGFVAAFQPLPLVVSFCGDDLLGTPDGRGGVTTKSRAIVWLSRYAARRADAIICKSEELRNALPHAARGRAFVLPNGVDVKRFSCGDRQAARRRLGIDPRELVVLFPHTPGVHRKRFDVAEASMARLVADGTVARLQVVHGVRHSDMPDYYRAADCLLVTSDQEGSPNVVKEALCCDLPVVSVDVGDARRWIDLAPGSVVAARDPDAIATELRRVLCNGSRCDGSLVRAEISVGRIAERVLDVYRVAMNGRVRRQ